MARLTAIPIWKDAVEPDAQNGVVEEHENAQELAKLQVPGAWGSASAVQDITQASRVVLLTVNAQPTSYS